MEFLKNLVPQELKNYYHLLQAIVANLTYGFPARKIRVIGVTGTDGKTTTTHLIYHLLKSAGLKVSMVSSVAAYIKDKPEDIGFHVTTPRFFPLQRLIKRAVDSGSDYIVIEVTSHALDQNRLWGIPFYIGVFTNLTHEHLDYHKTMEKYLGAKMKLFNSTKFAVLNMDDPSFKKLERKVSGRIVTYGLKFNADVKAKDIEFSDQGVSFETEGIKISSPLLGEYNVYNMLAAVGVAEALGVSNNHIKAALANFPVVTGRMERVENDRGLEVIVDFAHTPNGVKNALQTVKKLAKRKLIAVFGSAGKRDITKRPKMGEAASQFADITVLTAEDPRGEDVTKIAREVASGGNFQEEKNLFIVPDRAKAVDFAINKIAQKGDTVIFLGKSHEKSMNIDGKNEEPWSEFDVINKALENKN